MSVTLKSPDFPRWGFCFLFAVTMLRDECLIEPAVHLRPSRRLTLVVTEQYERENITELMATLSLRGPFMFWQAVTGSQVMA